MRAIFFVHVVVIVKRDSTPNLRIKSFLLKQIQDAADQASKNPIRLLWRLYARSKNLLHSVVHTIPGFPIRHFSINEIQHRTLWKQETRIKMQELSSNGIIQ